MSYSALANAKPDVRLRQCFDLCASRACGSSARTNCRCKEHSGSTRRIAAWATSHRVRGDDRGPTAANWDGRPQPCRRSTLLFRTVDDRPKPPLCFDPGASHQRPPTANHFTIVEMDAKRAVRPSRIAPVHPFVVGTLRGCCNDGPNGSAWAFGLSPLSRMP